MKIKEYIEETAQLILQFESESTNNGDTALLYRLFDAIDLRLRDIEIWSYYGLTEDDEVPLAPNKLIIPSFE